MKQYYVNNTPQQNGEHEIHVERCVWMPENITYLGTFTYCESAVALAKKQFKKAVGCKFCSVDCYTN